MDEARLILRTAVRTLHPSPPLAPLLLDTLLHHTVLHLDDFYALTTIPQKELRGHLQPLRAARLIHVHSRREHQLQTQRDATREYYYIHYSDAVNVIKYRLNKLRSEIQTQYLTAQGPETLKCPRCGSTWNELDIVPTHDGNLPCPKCSYPDVGLNEAAFKEQGAHESIQKLNSQLAKFNALFAAFDAKLAANQFRDPKFEEQFLRRKVIPREAGGRSWQWTEVKRGRERESAAGAVDENALELNITSAANQALEDKVREKERRERVAAANAKPEWMQVGAVRGGAGGGALDITDDSPVVKREGGIGAGLGGSINNSSSSSSAAAAAAAAVGFKKEEGLDEKKPLLDLLNAPPSNNNPSSTTAFGASASAANTPNAKSGSASDALMEQYMLDMQREQAELEAARRKRAEGSSRSGSDDEEDDDDDEDDDGFEDVPGTGGAGTPRRGGGGGGGGMGMSMSMGSGAGTSAMNTPASSQGGRLVAGKESPRSAVGTRVGRSSANANGLGLKREREREYDEFEESSDAATPMSVSVSVSVSVSDDMRERDGSGQSAAKRVKLEGGGGVAGGGGVESGANSNGKAAAAGALKAAAAAAEEEESDDEMEFEDA